MGSCARKGTLLTIRERLGQVLMWRRTGTMTKQTSVSSGVFKGYVLCENLVVQQYGLLYSNDEKSVNSYSEQSTVSATLISRCAIRLCPEPSSTPVLTIYFSKMDFNVIIPFFS